MYKALILSFCMCSYIVWTVGKLNGKNPKYNNLWVAKIEGGEEVAQRIARDLGYSYKGQLGHFENYYELIKEDHPEVSYRDSEHLTRSLLDLDEVKWADQQRLVRPVTYALPPWGYSDEVRSSYIISFLKQEALKQYKNDRLIAQCTSIFSCITYYPTNLLIFLSSIGQGDIQKLGTFPTTAAPKKLLTRSSSTTYPIGLLSRKISAYILEYNDPYWKRQWYMQDYRTKVMPVMDLNVVPVHQMGYTGMGVKVAVVDNGVEHYNFDFKHNFMGHLSIDTCRNIRGSQPVGHSHGTNCAGVIAMTPNNELCGVGIAYNANIVGIRAICDGEQAQAATAKALMHGNRIIDIYSNSWGYAGEGKHVFSKDHLSEEAYYQGVTMGRNKNGVIFVRTAGNDKGDGDNCAVDPDINSPYAITIAGADQWGKPAYYSERCTAIMATTYTLGKSTTEGIVAPNIGGGCTTRFSGTSAACPQASGIIALVLEANPELKYRDVMHLIAMSAEVAPLADNEDTWYKNSRGFWVSNDFGFGIMNAENMVKLALDWVNVPPLKKCIVSAEINKPIYFDKTHDAIIEFSTSACKGSRDEVNYLEHIELASVVGFPYRGDIEVYIKSPNGTVTQLLEPRPNDNDPDGLEGLAIVSTHNWGEHSRGTWTLTYKASEMAHRRHYGLVHDFALKLYGTKTKPAHYMGEYTREYAAFRLPDGQTSLS